MASNVCFRGAAGGPALGRTPSPAQSSPAAEAPHSPGERALRAWLPRDGGLGGVASGQAVTPAGTSLPTTFPAGDSGARHPLAGF